MRSRPVPPGSSASSTFRIFDAPFPHTDASRSELTGTLYSGAFHNPARLRTTSAVGESALLAMTGPQRVAEATTPPMTRAARRLLLNMSENLRDLGEAAQKCVTVAPRAKKMHTRPA